MINPPNVSSLIFFVDGVVAFISSIVLGVGMVIIFHRFIQRRKLPALFALVYVTLFFIDMVVVTAQNWLYYYGIIDWPFFIYIQFYRFILLNTGVAFTAIFAANVYERWKIPVIIISGILFISGIGVFIANYMTGPGGELPSWGKLMLGISGMFDIIGYLPFIFLSYMESRTTTNVLGKRGCQIMMLGASIGLLTPLFGTIAIFNRILYYTVFGYFAIICDGIGNFMMVVGFVMPQWLRKLLIEKEKE